MDAANRRPQLLALSYLDVGKTKREEDSYSFRHTDGLQNQNGVPPGAPSFQYPSGPPPPYSHPPSEHANNWPGVKSAVHTPPDQRRTSGEEHDSTKQTTRQSLPSISEALGVDSQTSFPASTSTPLQTSQSTHLPQPLSAAPLSPRSAERRSYPMEPPQPHNPYQYSYFRQDSAGPQTYALSDPAKPGYGPHQDSRPSLHLQTSQPPPRAPVPTAQPTASPRFEQQTSQSSGSMGPPSFPYGYTPYPPKYAQPELATKHPSGPIYQPSTQFAAPQTPPSSWKAESASSRYPDDHSASIYGESVKRHLDLYDLEAALSEISQISGIMQDFSRRYGDRMHQDARTGSSLSTLPSMIEVDDMINKSQVQVDSLNKIREVILTQQLAYEQQMADHRQQHKAFAESPASVADHHPDGVENKDIFAGSDTKKRRGRAAPPGRCHSCNRAETPEWRRGPDGARTLCNACGLHYAKLTRKQTTASKTANVGNSNLRPKES
ncbi:glutamate--cysteine ligase [Vermiconidia calcicola]|uniref:Glutamate--cysteine ligase n=1 Tax=Vermiconidia calcicola TaxID=1690605 RepID=A0ACC3NFB4_9PEZI|nr:glutamate--cysteine ligase [Vermiconidia calcicola]